MAEPGTVTRAVIGEDGGGDQELAGRLCRACVDGLDIDGAAMSVLTARVSRETLWATDATAEMLEDLQFSLNEGACMEAAASGRPVLVPDLRHGTESTRWPLFAAAVADRTTVAALFALPLQWGAVNLGVLDLYRVTPGALTGEQRRDALGAVDAAALMLLGMRTDPGEGRSAHAEEGPVAEHTVGNRTEVHQATGMVLAQLDVDATDALARMRAHAFVRGLLLIDVARDVVARRLVFGQDMT